MLTWRSKEKKDGMSLLAACLAALAISLTCTPAGAAVDCGAVVAGADDDKDGFLNSEECAGITLPAGFTTPLGATGIPYPRCSGAEDRATCLDPNTPDLFVILKPAVPSKIPSNPWEFVTKSVALGGLGIVVHEIRTLPNNASRLIGSRENAVSISESLAAATTADKEFGVTPIITTPNGSAFSTVFTGRIETDVNTKCDASTTCVDSGSGISGKTNLVPLYIKHTLAHECSHMLYLTKIANDRFGGNHYKTTSGYVMDQSVISTTKNGVTTFFITKIYAVNDPADMLLK